MSVRNPRPQVDADHRAVAVAATTMHSIAAPGLAWGLRGLQLRQRLKTLNGLTRYEFICDTWSREPDRFTLNPLQQMPRLNS